MKSKIYEAYEKTLNSEQINEQINEAKVNQGILKRNNTVVFETNGSVLVQSPWGNNIVEKGKYQSGKKLSKMSTASAKKVSDLVKKANDDINKLLARTDLMVNELTEKLARTISTQAD